MCVCVCVWEGEREIPAICCNVSLKVHYDRVIKMSTPTIRVKQYTHMTLPP